MNQYLYSDILCMGSRLLGHAVVVSLAHCVRESEEFCHYVCGRHDNSVLYDELKEGDIQECTRDQYRQGRREEGGGGNVSWPLRRKCWGNTPMSI